MGFDLESIDQLRTKWIDLPPPFDGVQLLVKYASPLVSERFKAAMLHKGIMRRTKEGVIDTAPGRDVDYLRAYAKEYVLDWRETSPGAIKPAGAPYNSDQMAGMLGAARPVFESVEAAIADTDGFFGSGVSGSTPN